MLSLPGKSGSCTICKRKGYTEWHHIISQHHAVRTGQDELLENPDNLIELCKSCHDQTTASMVRKRLLKQGKRIVKQPRQRKNIPNGKKNSENVAAKSETRQERRQRIEAERKLETDRIEASISNLSLRGVFWKDSPYNKLAHLANYLTKVSSEDQLAEKWLGILNKPPGIDALYPKDHWLHNEEKFDKSMSSEFEKDGFCWTINGGVWRKDLSKERANFEINLAQLKGKQRQAIENLQRVAAAHHERERKRIQLEESIVSLENRGVYSSESPVSRIDEFWSYLEQVRANDEIAQKWVDLSKNKELRNFNLLYPKDHWLNNPDKFNSELSDEFESDGFCWTKNGGAWKIGLTKEQANAEIALASLISRENDLVEQEKKRREIEIEELENEKRRIESIESLKSRNVFEIRWTGNFRELVSYLSGTSFDSKISKKWADYFKENSHSRIYPKDHWLHQKEEFDSKMSKQFEKDGFGWTENGGIWKIGLSKEQANAEIRLAQVKEQQQKILEREQAKVDNLREN